VIRVVRPGLETTVQDAGRPGLRAYGVPVGGAADARSLRIANVLVGNPPDAPALEITLKGPELVFEQAAVVALVGADLGARLNGLPMPMWRPVAVAPSAALSFAGAAGPGARVYLAVAGGLAVPKVLGGFGTYVRGRFGGFGGRPLAAGDRLPVGRPSAEAEAFASTAAAVFRNSAEPAWTVPWSATVYSSFWRPVDEPVLRVMMGPEAQWFTEESLRAFVQERFRVSPASDRMGCRLEGPVLRLAEPREMASTAVMFGTIQVPPNGRPVLLSADCQTTGGYPRIAQVISADWPVVGQLRPGDVVRFEPVTAEEAETALFEEERALRELEAGVRLRWRQGCEPIPIGRRPM